VSRNGTQRLCIRTHLVSSRIFWKPIGFERKIKVHCEHSRNFDPCNMPTEEKGRASILVTEYTSMWTFG
jgi:hypothetical protein